MSVSLKMVVLVQTRKPAFLAALMPSTAAVEHAFALDGQVVRFFQAVEVDVEEERGWSAGTRAASS